MSLTRTLKDKAKNAQEVTSLEASDRLLAIDTNGSQKKISRTNLINQGLLVSYSAEANSTGRWIRIAEMADYGSSCILTISVKGYSGGWYYPLTMLVTAPHANSLETISIVSLSPRKVESSNGIYPFSKIRITGSEANKYIDIFVSNSTVRHMNILMSCAMLSSLVTPVENPTTSTKVKEFDVSNLWGGVIGYLPITYNYTEQDLVKGGAHERHKNACGQAEIGADGYLSFGSLDAMCEFIGKTMELDTGESYPSDFNVFGCRPSNPRLDSDRSKYNKCPVIRPRRIPADTTVRCSSKDTNILCVDSSSFLKKTFFWGPRRSLAELVPVSDGLVTPRKEVAL